MAVEEQATGEQAQDHVVEIMLVSGEKIRAVLGLDEQAARAELEGVHGRLHSDVFLRVGEDTIVRAEEVRWLRLRPQDENDGGLIDTLMTKVRGGDEMSNYETHRTQHNQGGGMPPWIGYGRRPYSETKPFFLTSEFLAFAGMLAALLIALGVSDSLNHFRGWLLPTILTSAYIISRGIAKAGERDPNPERFQQNHGPQDGYADQGMSRERPTETYGTVPR
jgi:hypothetical protein